MAKMARNQSRLFLDACCINGGSETIMWTVGSWSGEEPAAFSLNLCGEKNSIFYFAILDLRRSSGLKICQNGMQLLIS
jgi:hypothetical protein